jgi:FG-GAP-like repeat/FG-GAP repeat
LPEPAPFARALRSWEARIAIIHEELRKRGEEGTMTKRIMKQHAIFLGVLLIGFLSVLSYAQAPVPFISLPLVPDATPPGGADFILTVNGTGFVSNSVVNWSNTPLATQFVSESKLTATVPAAGIATASTAWVTVVNPAPGGGTSNTAFFTVTANTGNSVGFGLASIVDFGCCSGGPTAEGVGDFNGDGKLDLAVVNLLGGVSILLGDGTGDFRIAFSTGTADFATAVAVGDFNGDGKLDLAVVATFGSDSVFVLLGDGKGNFVLASTLATDVWPMSVAVGDFNGDGKLDLAVTNVCGKGPCWGPPGTVSVFLGDGTGKFTLASSPTTGNWPQSIVVGDFNGDGKLDLVVANRDSDTLSILLGDGTGNFTLASSPATGDEPDSVGVGDFNGDGKLDLAVTDVFDCSVLLGDDTGNFTQVSTLPGQGAVAVGDFNGDSKLDLALSGGSVLLGDGTGSFTPAASFPGGASP